MALERINPFEREDRFCLDHLVRYAWASELVGKKRVLDVACGLGFGTTMLIGAGAKSAVGVDLDEPAIRKCQKWWDHPGIVFKGGDIEKLQSMGMEPFDRVVCFETLEHLQNPDLALQSIKSVMDPGGVLLGSVPGEYDVSDDNEFHHQHFSRQQLKTLLNSQFSNIRIYRQRYHLGSTIEDMDARQKHPVQKENLSGIRVDFGRSREWADTYVFMASDVELPDSPVVASGLSRQAWIGECESADKASTELKSVLARFQDLFSEHGELQRQFTNVLGWGKYNYAKANGKEPEEHYLQSIEQAQSAREVELRAQVKELQREVNSLRKELANVEQEAAENARKNRTSFQKTLNS